MITFEQWSLQYWSEEILNQSVRGLYEKNPSFNGGLEVCWYLTGVGVTMWRESDGRSPVEPTVPGDSHGRSQNL